MRVGAGRLRRRQNLGYAVGAVAGTLALVALLLPVREAWLARGPMNSGHETLACDFCHQPAPGTLRQQLQANLRHLAGWRRTSADFGREDVTNETCLACHERPDDRHPVYRFLEPRFAKVRAALAPQRCESCHREHRGVRITLAETGYCTNCHEDTRLRRDPVDVSHEQLIAADRWVTCLGCHDFHGNHVMQTATLLADARTPARVRAYFDGGASPYGTERRHPARKEPRRD